MGSVTIIPVTHSLIFCLVNSLSIKHLTAHIWPAAVYFCMAIITICAHFRASYILCEIINSAFLAVLGMPIEMYGERRQRDLQARRPNVQYTAGL